MDWHGSRQLGESRNQSQWTNSDLPTHLAFIPTLFFQLGNEIVLAHLPATSSSAAKSALYGADSLISNDVEEAHITVTDAIVEPNQADLAERAVLYATSIPARTSWASNADASGSTLAQGASLADYSHASSSRSSPPTFETGLRGVQGKLPLPEDSNALGVMLKVYDLEAAERLQVSGLVEVVGILDRSPMPHAEWASSGAPATSASGQITQSYPALHVILCDQVADVWSSRQPSQPAVIPTTTSSSSPGSGRQAILSRLTNLLQGDAAAAEWLFLSSIASVHTRKVPFALGHLSLRLLLGAGSNPEIPAQLQAFLESVLPCVAPLDLTLEKLNDPNVRYSPKSDPDTGALLAGRLQLAPGTTLLVNESITEGKLGEHGLQNLQSISETAKNSTLQYLFPFSPAPYALPVDIGVILVSGAGQTEAGSSGAGGGLVPVDVDVAVASPATATGEYEGLDLSSLSLSGGGESSSSTGSTTTLAAMRQHLLRARALARALRVSESVAEAIQKDFVSSRTASDSSSSSHSASSTSQPQSQSQSQEDLLRRMDIARLLCASHGRSELDFADYQAAKEMDAQRIRALDQRKEEQKRQASARQQQSSVPGAAATSSSSAAASTR